MDIMKELHELCETITRSIQQANEKIRAAGGKVTSGDMEYIDRLTHSLKSIKAVMAMIEEAEMEDEYSERGSYRRGYSREGGSYARGGRGGGYSRGSYDDGGSYARGRNARRDNMGRYSRDGYSEHGELVDELRQLMEQAPDQQTRQEMQRLVEKIEQR